ncbi:MAG: tRNA lysidine(34) synthetase TilS [Paracoccaceae bacterium]
MPLSLPSGVTTSIETLLADAPTKRLGVAVSGGGDSTALLHIAALWGRAAGVAVHAVTVDHGLRNGSADEAAAVGAFCARLRVPHTVLNWSGAGAKGNLQDVARRARYGLMAGWAAQNRICDILLGHTLDDQAETVLMRLARGSGVDGLSGMAGARRANGVRWLRPLLQTRREELRDYLRENDLDWCEDPSNLDAKYDRIKARAALETLAGLGITPRGLAETAQRMSSARRALELATQSAACELASVAAGTVSLRLEGLFELPEELRRRLLVHSLCWAPSARYPPRQAALEGLLKALKTQKTATLHGCLITIAGDHCLVTRELSAVAGLRGRTDQIWDNRWRISGPAEAGYYVAVLGENGLKSCPDWRKCGLDRATIIAAPAIWHESRLIAAPIAGLANDWCAQISQEAIHFHSAIISH